MSLKINRFVMLAAVALLMTGVSQAKASFSYYTSGSSSVTGTGGVSLHYNAIPSGSPVTSPSDPFVGSLGSFYWNGPAFNLLSTLSGNFTLTIHQTVPNGGTGDFVATVSGFAFLSASGAFELDFPNPTVQIVDNSGGTTTYTLRLDNDNDLDLSSSRGSGNAVTLFADVSYQPAAVAAPEPATLSMLGMAGMSLAGYFGWRRRKQPWAA